MKKLFSALLALTFVFSMSTSSFADGISTDGQECAVESGGYTFMIAERTDDNHRIIRTYEKDRTSVEEATSLDETKALLVALGMDEDNVEALSEETLQDFAEGSQITIVTSYTKADENNNVTYLDEATALAESAELKAQQDSLSYNLARGIATATDEDEHDYEEYYKDSYMKITYAIDYMEDESYLFSVDAKWLTLPSFCGYDSIGSCAMNCTVISSTRSGSYSYRVQTVDNLNYSITYDNITKNITNYSNASDGNWYGSAGVIQFPSDIYTTYSMLIYDSFKAHYQYRGHVLYPTLESWFNAVASYDHATVMLSFTPSVSIDYTKAVSASISLNISGDTDTRSAELEVHYVPD